MLPDTLIVTPTVGNRSTIDKTVKSIRDIGGDRVSHVIVCPNSAMARMKDRFPHSSVLEEESPNGVYAAVNFGLRQAAPHHRYLGYLNDDDYWFAGFADLFKALDSKSDVSVAYGRTLYVTKGDKPLFELPSYSRYKSLGTLLAQRIAFLAQPAALFRRSVYDCLGGFDESYKLYADTDFWIRAIESNHRFKFVNSRCAGYLVQAGLMLTDRSKSEGERLKVLESHGITRDYRGRLEKLRFRCANFIYYLKRIRQFGFSSIDNYVE